ncbi:MAG TPA: hypothetical protein VMU93_12280 [Caulobacteraceae bacterium]|nr:hypothetical protein [Caulobacteraceae bacterium]
MTKLAEADMSDLERALAEIGAIRSQIARGAQFHGLGPTTFAATALLAFLAAAGQARWIAPADVGAFLALWIAVAAVSAGVIAFEMVARSRRLHSQLADEMIAGAVTQFLPAAAVGALLTLVMLRFSAQGLWMLPGLWQIVFGLGVFASCRFLPRAMALVGGWYVATGVVCIALAQGPGAFSPWAMGVPFGVGQLIVAAVLRFGGTSDE